MSHPEVLDKYILKELPPNLDRIMLLDVACGLGHYAFKIRTEKDGNPTIVGLDIWKPYLLKIKRLRLYDDLIVGDAINLPFRDKAFQIVLACAVIEHLPKNKGIAFLSEIERVAKDIIVVVTPCGFMSQGAIRGNPYERHRSGWMPKDFISRGYRVKTVYYRPLHPILNIIRKIRNLLMSAFSSKKTTDKAIIAVKRKIGERKNG